MSDQQASQRTNEQSSERQKAEGPNGPPATIVVPAAEGAALERYKATLDFWKHIIVGGLVAITIAAIPPVFQFATAKLEETKANAERSAKQEQFREDYVKSFMEKGLDQDIELRLRLADYFASVSPPELKEGWVDYRTRLEDKRKDVRNEINDLEKKWRALASVPNSNQGDIDELERKLTWDYKELGYVERNRSVSTNPRLPEQAAASLAQLDFSAEDIPGDTLQALLNGGMTLGVDIARGNVDFAALRKQGVSFAFIKASEGSDFVNPSMTTSANSANVSNTMVSLYHFYRSGIDVNAQFKTFAAVLEKTSWNLPPALDIEATKEAGFTDDIAQFCKLLEEHFHIKPILYVGDFAKTEGASYPLWIPKYTRGTIPPKKEYVFWQISGQGRFGGQSFLGVDLFKGNIEQLHALTVHR
jgi:GH25 family lysozyme M1 (1,4-beta-N-acetylmuramidase)